MALIVRLSIYGSLGVEVATGPTFLEVVNRGRSDEFDDGVTNYEVRVVSEGPENAVVVHESTFVRHHRDDGAWRLAATALAALRIESTLPGAFE